MTIKELERCRTILFEKENLEERIARLRSRAESTTQQLRADPGTPSADNDKLASYAVKLDALEHRLTDRLIALEDLRQRVDVWLSTLPEQQAVVMRLRYIDGLKWRETAEKAGYTPEHCRKINGAAIRKMDTQ